jgi:16S rRNA (cytidine1402-2'-O)-methyltransferase
MESKSSGKLIVAGLDIGNAEDVPKRTIYALEHSDFIVAEHAKIMEESLDRRGIKYVSPMYNYLPELEDRNERIDHICNRIESGETVLLISSEGMPLIHDPGYEIVLEVRKRNLPISVIPGPSAPIAALAVSGLDTWRFVFESDVPTDFDEREKVFKSVVSSNKTAIFFEKDWQLVDSLDHLGKVAGFGKPVAVCINLTMPDETIVRGSVQKVMNHFKNNPMVSEQEEEIKVILLVGHGPHENIN